MSGVKVYDVLDLTQPGVVLGNHGCWLPGRGIKIPFQWGGRIQKYSRPGEQAGHRDTIVDEVSILRALAAEQMAPPVGDYVFFKNVISNYLGAWHCDPCGAYGYEVADANKLPPGKFDIERMRRLPIEGSAGAWGDVLKPGNVVNGYLVDVRRSQQDLLRWTATGWREELPSVWEELEILVARAHRLAQFPAGERDVAYQDFWVGGALQRGQRRVEERAELLGFRPEPGDGVLDVGTQVGGFLQYASVLRRRLLGRRSGAESRLVGVDVNADYIDIARDLARSSWQNICYRKMDVVAEHDAFISWVRAYFPNGVTHFLCLSLEKHLGDDGLFRLIDAVGARKTYIETNAVGKADADAKTAPMKLWDQVKKRGGRHVGDSRDRNLRRLYRIER